MILMVNKLTGGDMWVADNRVEEYKAAGHKLAAFPELKPIKKPAKKSATKKTASKK